MATLPPPALAEAPAEETPVAPRADDEAASRRTGSASEASTAFRTAAVGVMVVGTTLRLLAYADRRPLWMDELMLALNIGTRSYGGFAHQPLDYGQTAPLFFLWAERLASRAAGMGEWTLRALPLALGLALLPLLWNAGRRLLGEREALVALACAALSQSLFYYSNEAKQYGADAFFTAALLWGTAAVLAEPERRRSWLVLGAIGLLAAGFSQPSVFVIAGVVAALALAPAVRASPRWLARLTALSAAWGALTVALYALVYRAAAADPYMRRVWSAVFLTPDAPDLGRRFRVSVREVLLQTILSASDGPEASRAALAIAALAYAGGGAALWLGARDDRRGFALAALFTLPVAGVFAASALGAYPVSVRLVLFLSPVVFLTYGVAVTTALDAWPGRMTTALSWARHLLFAAALLGIVWWRYDWARDEAESPRRYEDTRDIILDYLRRGSPDPVYVYAGGVPSWAFYTTDWRAPDTVRLAWLARVAGPSGPAFENMASRGRRLERHEGDSLAYDARGHREIIGLGMGMEYLQGRGRLQNVPDTGWAENEARRVHDAVNERANAGGGRSAWVYLAHHRDVQREALLTALRQRGGSVETVRWANAAELYRVTFEPRP